MSNEDNLSGSLGKNAAHTISICGNTSIADKTPLIRYMKLSTFLLLLDNKLFLPNVQKLQESEPLEANIQPYYLSNYWREMWPLVEPHKVWLISEVLRKEADAGWDRPSKEKRKTLLQAWTQALGERRGVWCWNQSVDEAYALWKIYGDHGVAIYSTVGKVRTALQKAGVEAGICFPSDVYREKRGGYEEAPRTGNENHDRRAESLSTILV